VVLNSSSIDFPFITYAFRRKAHWEEAVKHPLKLQMPSFHEGKKLWDIRSSSMKEKGLSNA
jgi:hypothetical protein